MSVAPIQSPFVAVPEVFMDPSNDDENPAVGSISPISSNASAQGPDFSLYQLVGAFERVSMIDMARYARTHPELFDAMFAAMNLASGNGEAEAAPPSMAPPSQKGRTFKGSIKT